MEVMKHDGKEAFKGLGTQGCEMARFLLSDPAIACWCVKLHIYIYIYIYLYILLRVYRSAVFCQMCFSALRRDI